MAFLVEIIRFVTSFCKSHRAINELSRVAYRDTIHQTALSHLKWGDKPCLSLKEHSLEELLFSLVSLFTNIPNFSALSRTISIIITKHYFSKYFFIKVDIAEKCRTPVDLLLRDEND